MPKVVATWPPTDSLTRSLTCPLFLPFQDLFNPCLVKAYHYLFSGYDNLDAPPPAYANHLLPSLFILGHIALFVLNPLLLEVVLGLETIRASGGGINLDVYHRHAPFNRNYKSLWD